MDIEEPLMDMDCSLQNPDQIQLPTSYSSIPFSDNSFCIPHNPHNPHNSNNISTSSSYNTNNHSDDNDLLDCLGSALLTTKFDLKNSESESTVKTKTIEPRNTQQIDFDSMGL